MRIKKFILRVTADELRAIISGLSWAENEGMEAPETGRLRELYEKMLGED